ncbi:MAG: Nickel/cobalt efflux system [Herbaspirillum sp.]|nr:Nickel/cobalt efflux system [Herbaspirillum sp.]
METLPHDWLGLVLVVFALGLKHGMDPDHLATIDGLTRYNARVRPSLSRWSGVLFSLGHGVVVMIVSALVALTANRWSAPAWLDTVGIWISIVFLTLLGFVNLRAVFKSAPGQVVLPVGLKGRFVKRFSETSHPVVITAIGAAFALSFDTVSQAALFSITASNISGWVFAIGLGSLFMIGMMVSDGLNGFWVARLLSKSDQRSLIASRVMGLVIGFLSLAIAAMGLAKYFSPMLSDMLDNAGLLMGAGVIAILLFSFFLAMRLSRPVRIAEPQRGMA